MSDLSTIISLAGRQISDATGITWNPTTVVIPYINLGIQEIINLKPEAYPVTVDITLAAGPVQALPSGGLTLIDAKYNLSGTSSPWTPDKAILSIKKEKMDDIFPDWMTQLGTTIVSFVVTDDRDPKVFYTYPPQPTSPSPSNKIRALISQMPTAMASPAETLPLDSSYVPALVDYVTYRALAEENSIPNAITKAQGFYQKFLQGIGIKNAVDVKDSGKGK